LNKIDTNVESIKHLQQHDKLYKRLAGV
jgi:hypothetical protein